VSTKQPSITFTETSVSVAKPAASSHWPFMVSAGIQHRLNDFMQVHGTEPAAALAPKLKNMDRQQIKNPALVRATAYLSDAVYG